MTPAPTQSIAGLLSGSIHTYRKNFGKLFLLFLVPFIAVMLPVLLNLNEYTSQVQQARYYLDSTPVFTVAYILLPLLQNGFLVWQIAVMWVIAVFSTPFIMGIAGKIASEDAVGRPCTFAEAARFTLGNYKHLLSAYTLYYSISTAFGAIFAALFWWLGKGANHIIQEAWLYPVITMFSIGGILLLIGTVYVPFVAMEGHKGSFRAYAGSFKAMYSRNFGRSFPGLVLATVIAGAVAFAATLPVTLPLLTGDQANALMYFGDNNSVFVFILLFAAVLAFVGVFLYIFAYNTYRKANVPASRRERENVTAYRRKLHFVEPTYRRRIG